MKSFNLFKRNDNYFYAKFKDPLTHELVSVKSTRCRNRDAAMVRAYEMLADVRKAKYQSPMSTIIDMLTNKRFEETEIKTLYGVLTAHYPKVFVPMTVTVPAVDEVKPAEVKAPAKKTPLLEYITRFWNYDESEYVKDKLAHNQRIGKRHCYEQSNLVRYWREFFTVDEALEDLTVERLRSFEKYLQDRHEDKTLKNTNGKPIKPLSPTTMKNIIRCGGISFVWAVKQGYIRKNPEEALTAYSTVSKERGILTAEEARSLFRRGKWEDERFKVASKLAMITGLRIGEILGLRLCDIGDDRIYIRKAWSTKDHLKCPKNTKERKVPIHPQLRKELLRLAYANPHKNAFKETDVFVFWGTLPDKPIVQNQITEGFKDALYSIGISEEQRKERNIVFHSWRHFYATTIANDVDEKHAQMILGHETPAMTKHYADHQREKDFEEMVGVTTRLYDELLA